MHSAGKGRPCLHWLITLPSHRVESRPAQDFVYCLFARPSVFGSVLCIKPALIDIAIVALATACCSEGFPSHRTYKVPEALQEDNVLTQSRLQGSLRSGQSDCMRGSHTKLTSPFRKSLAAVSVLLGFRFHAGSVTGSPPYGICSKERDFTYLHNYWSIFACVLNDAR